MMFRCFFGRPEWKTIYDSEYGLLMVCPECYTVQQFHRLFFQHFIWKPKKVR